MSDTTAAETTAAETQAHTPGPATTTHTRHGKRRCRYIRTAGEQCDGPAMTGKHYCWHHDQNRNPKLANIPGYSRINFLEDTASIQLSISQAMQGLLDHTIEVDRARAIFFAASVSNSVLRTVIMQRRWSAEHKQPTPEPVTETTMVDREPLGPDQEYRGPNNTFEPQWSFAKYLYEQQCEQAGRPKPTCAEDFPASGWLTEDEIKEGPDAFNERLNARSLEEFEKAQAAAKNNPCPPEPVDGPEWTDEDMEFMLERCWCGGMEKGNPCDYCLLRHRRYEAHLWKQKQNPPAPQQPNNQPSKQNTDTEEGTVDLNAAAERCPVDRCTLNAVPGGNRQNLLLRKLHKTKHHRRPPARGANAAIQFSPHSNRNQDQL
jgi:hypothetical protein